MICVIVGIVVIGTELDSVKNIFSLLFSAHLRMISFGGSSEMVEYFLKIVMLEKSVPRVKYLLRKYLLRPINDR